MIWRGGRGYNTANAQGRLEYAGQTANKVLEDAGERKKKKEKGKVTDPKTH